MQTYINRFLMLLAAACPTTPWALPLSAQTPGSPQVPSTTGPASTGPASQQVYSLVPTEGVACLSVHIQQIKRDPALRLFPWEILSAACLDGLGIDVSEMDRLDLIIGPIGREPVVAGVLTSSQKIDLSQLNPQGFTLGNDGQSYAPASHEFRSYVVRALNEKQVAITHAELFETFLSARHDEGELLKQMKRLGNNSHISLVVIPETIRPILRQASGNLSPELMAASQVLIEKVQLLAAKAQVNSNNPTINILVETASEADAAEALEAWDDVARYIGIMSSRNMVLSGRSPDMEPAIQSYVGRVSRETRAVLKPTQKGNRLLLTLDQRAINLLRGMVTVANFTQTYTRFVNSGGQYRRRAPTRDVDKLKEHALAIHNFESAYRRLPGGKTDRVNDQLSWRVYLLPFFGDPKLTELFQQFKLDEPWDSEANAKLIPQMPSIYRYSKAKVPKGHTVFQMPQGPGLIIERDKTMRFRDVLDGLSNTAMVAVSTDEAAVPWTKPDDFNPLENLDLVRRDDNQIKMAMGDGSVSTLPADTELNKLKALLTRAGAD